MADKYFIPVPRRSMDMDADLGRIFSRTVSAMCAEDEMMLDQFVCLRNGALTLDVKDDACALTILYQYYNYLKSLEAVFRQQNAVAQMSLWQEKFHVLYNIGATLSQLGSSQDFEVDDGLNRAKTHFQQSLAVFHYIDRHFLAASHQEPFLLAAAAVMTGYTQEALLMKAGRDKIELSEIAAIATQTADYYGEVAKATQSLAPNSDTDWPAIAACKQDGYMAIAEYYQSLVHRGNRELGAELTRLRTASDLMRTARSRLPTASRAFPFEDAQAIILRDDATAREDNDFIHHVRVPDAGSLEPIKRRASLPDAVEAYFFSATVRFGDGALPREIQPSGSAVEALNRTVNTLREQSHLLTIRHSLPMDAVGGSLGPLRERESETDVSGIVEMRKTSSQHSDMLSRNRDILDECERLLAAELAADEESRKKFTDRWTRMPSSRLNPSLRAELRQYRAFLMYAEKADPSLRIRHLYNGHPATVSETSSTSGAIRVQRTETNGETHELDTVEDLCDAIKALILAREKAENDLKTGLNSSSRSLRSPTTTETELPEELRVLIQSVQEVMRKIGNRAIQDLHDRFFTSNKLIRSRDEQHIENLSDFAMTLQMEKFYADITEGLLQFQFKIGDFCFARNTEREELAREMEEDQASSSALRSPTFHEGCIICRSARITTAFVPCGHKKFCIECAEQAFRDRKECPCCRAVCTQVMRVFD